MRIVPFCLPLSYCCFLASVSAGQAPSDAPLLVAAAEQTPDPAQPAQPPTRPLNPTQEIAGQVPEGNALDVGPAKLRIGGYVGVSALYRSTNGGGGTGTSFASLPYPDTVQGNVSETRLSAQASRLSIRVDADFPEGRTRFHTLSGYFEMDFNGATPGTVAVTSSSVGFRLRHAFAVARYGDSFFLSAGQAFTLMTPAKDQLTTWPSDYEMTQAVDTNYVAGLVWGRVPQVRLAWRPSTRFNWAVSMENPEQQIGRAIVTLPSCCADDISAQYNTGSNELEVPNLMPDVVTRVALNPNKAVHLDVGGVLRAFRHALAPYDDSVMALGGGGSANFRLMTLRGTRFIAQTAVGEGMGRYVGGLVADTAFTGDGSIEPIGSTSWVAGVEQRISSTLSVAGYYSGVDTDERVAIDTDGSFIGFGFPGSSNSNNRAIREVTATGSWATVTTADRGSVQLSLQGSWVKREPWSASGPAAARSFMFFAQIRYNLP
jgi:hypothetical protein